RLRRWTWGVWRKLRVFAFERAISALRQAMGAFGSAADKDPAGLPEEDTQAWKDMLIHCARTLAAIERLHAYESGLVAMREADFGDLAARRNDLQTSI